MSPTEANGNSQPKENDFYRHFKENMDALRLPCPLEKFGSLKQTLETISDLIDVLKKYGKVSVAVLITRGWAPKRLQVLLRTALKVLPALSLAYYVGAVLGSALVAIDKTYCGGRAIDAANRALNPVALVGEVRAQVMALMHEYLDRTEIPREILEMYQELPPEKRELFLQQA